MSELMLEREPFSCDFVADQTDFCRDELADEAFQLLGYATTQAKTKRFEVLKRTMADLDIRPFTEKSVESYQKSCEIAPNPVVAAIVNFASGFGVLSAIICLPILVISAVSLNASLSFYLAVTVLIGGGSLISGAVFGDRFLVERVWLMHDLAHYTEPVPEFALQTAVDIKKRHPEVSFYICSLEENRMVLDPFLVMRVPYGHWYRDYYLEVWSEPKFSGEREQ